MSAAHIYHSALPLSPRTSIVRRLYEPYADPLTRIIQGVPMSWDPAIVAVRCSDIIYHIIWSPCSRFIAIDCKIETQILDATTLGKVKSLALEEHYSRSLTFSAESRLLTQLSDEPEEFISWDLQTGVPAGVISSNEEEREQQYPGGHQEWEEEPEGITQEARSITYSACETTFGVLFKRRNVAVIITYNVLSSTSTGYYPIERPVADVIWTHDKSIRFATFGPGSITIWEVGFVLEHPAAEVESLPTPNNFDPSGPFLFLPTCSRLAFILNDSVFVWDVRHSKLLLDSADIRIPKAGKMTFSSDGGFFACGTGSPEIYLWKDSPTGYTFHRKLVSSIYFPYPLLSPDGRSIIAFCNWDLQLWRTTDPTPHLLSVPARDPRDIKPFVLGFSPDESLAVAARLGDNTATVLDLRSGVPRLTVDAGAKIYGLGVTVSTVVVVGEGKTVTWNLPQRDHALDVTANINDSIRTTIFNYSPPKFHPPSSASISPDFNHIAIAGLRMGLRIYNMTTGKYLAGTDTPCDDVWFSPDGRKLWSHFTGVTHGWAIVKNSESISLKMEYLGKTRCPPGEYPWEPPCNYKITVDGWVFNPNGKRLLWLPPHWRMERLRGMWSGRFLAFSHSKLPEPVILELLE